MIDFYQRIYEIFCSISVIGFGIQQAGPYEDGEAQIQMDDIAGFEGVCNTHLISASDEAKPVEYKG